MNDLAKQLFNDMVAMNKVLATQYQVDGEATTCPSDCIYLNNKGQCWAVKGKAKYGCSKCDYRKQAPKPKIESSTPKPKIHYCQQCKKDMGNEWLLGPVCFSCCRKNHRKVVGH